MLYIEAPLERLELSRLSPEIDVPLENHGRYCVKPMSRGFSEFPNYEIEKRIAFEVVSDQMAFVSRCGFLLIT